MIPYTQHTITPSDHALVTKSLYGNLTRGNNVRAFEKAICKFVGASYCVSCSSGTDALWLAYGAVGVRHAIVPSITFNATANMVESHGGLVRFADCNHFGLMKLPERMNMDPTLVPVHMNGNSCDMHTLAAAGRRIVEDACHAFGARYNDNMVGCCEFSDACCFSFHPAKTITTGEGGCVTTNDKDLYEHMLALRNQGFRPGTHEQICHGRNCHLTEMQAAMGISQLRHVDEFLEKRRAIADVYCTELPDSVECLCMSEGSHHLFPIFTERRDEIKEHLAKHGFTTQIHYPALHLQEYWRSPVDLPGSVRYSETCLSLPVYPDLRLSDAKKVVKLVKEIVG